jgi:hypothetical protein
MSDKKDEHNKHYWDTDRNKEYNYTTPNQKVMMSVPEGRSFNKAYAIQDSAEKNINRKNYPIYTGVIKYFPDALLEVSRVSRIGNEQHHAGEPLHWDKSKSADHLDALMRHLLDADDCDEDGVTHLAKVAWRALAALQDRIDKERKL